MSTAHRYTDQMVRRYPVLISLAIEYAKAYDGEFEFMLAAQALARQGGTLPLGVARGVLNCLRVEADPIHQSLSAEAASVLEQFPATDEEDEERPTRQWQRPPRLRVVKPEPEPDLYAHRPTYVKTPVKIKLPFGIASGAKGGTRRVLHRIDPDSSYCEWQVMGYFDHRRRIPLEVPVPRLHVAWRHPGTTGWTRNPILLAEDDGTYDHCRSGCWWEDDEEGGDEG